MGKLSRSTLLGLVLVGACGEVKQDSTPDAPDGTTPDAPDAPGTVVLVSEAGDDTNDGIAAPVRTLKRALGIAAANGEITKITLQAGRYDAAAGETFPYVIPEQLAITGPAGGGAILAGTGTTPALMLGNARLADVELEQFSVAITANGAAELSNVRIRNSATGVRGEAGARLVADQLDITGVAGACGVGIELNGTATLDADTLGARELGHVALASDQSSLGITSGNVTGSTACATPVFDIKTSGAFALTDTIVDGGRIGVNFFGATTPTQATLRNTAIRNMSNNGMAGRSVVLTMTGGELGNNGRGGFEASGGSWTLTNVAIVQNTVMGIYIQGTNNTTPGTLKLRGCSITGNGQGVYLFDNVIADLGTDASPGGNTLQNNAGEGLDIDGNAGARQIDAVGNTWRPNVQLADASGKYRTATVSGPVDGGSALNFAINTGWSLRR